MGEGCWEVPRMIGCSWNVARCLVFRNPPRSSLQTYFTTDMLIWIYQLFCLLTLSLSLSLGNHNNLTIETKVGLNIWLLLFEYPAMTFSGHKSSPTVQPASCYSLLSVHFCYHHDQSLSFARSTRLGMHNY